MTSSAAIRFAPLLFVLLWSTGFIGAKYGLPHAEPLSFLLVRYRKGMTPAKALPVPAADKTAEQATEQATT